MDETIDAGVEEEEVQAPELQEGVETVTEVSSAEEKDDTDWEAIANNYKTALTQKRQLRKPPAPVIEEEVDEDKPLTRREFQELLQSTVVPLVSASKEESILLNKVADPAKRAYVRQLLESRIVRTGTSDQDVTNDIEAALAIADSQKKDKTITELKRAANNRPHAPSAGSSSEKPLEQKSHKWTAEQARSLEQKAQNLGLDPEKFKKDAWENQKRTRSLG